MTGRGHESPVSSQEKIIGKFNGETQERGLFSRVRDGVFRLAPPVVTTDSSWIARSVR